MNIILPLKKFSKILLYCFNKTINVILINDFFSYLNEVLFMINKKVYLIICTLIILIIGTGIVSAQEDNDTTSAYENEKSIVENSQQSFMNTYTKTVTYPEVKSKSGASISKTSNTSTKEAADSNVGTLSLNVSVVNNTIALESDAGSEVAITRNITSKGGVPDVKKLGVDYALADENGVYTIEGSEIRRVMKLDSYCQQIYGFTPKYTFFRALGSNVKYVISREKWNVIARSLNGYHVKQGYNAVNTPYSVTVNLSGKSRYYNVYFDAQEIINGQMYTCGPTAMSMISQALNCYASERRLAGIYGTTSWDGTDESSIIRYSPTAHMKLTNIQNTESSVKSALTSGKMVFWHIRGHYMCVIGYDGGTNKFLCLNPSGPSHNINAVQWATWTQMMNTDRGLKENGFMAVTPNWDLTSTDKTHAKYYYYNMGGKYTRPSNNEYCNNGYDNKVSVIADRPSNVPTRTNQTIFSITSKVSGVSLNEGNISVYLDGKLLKSSNVKGGVSINYTIPAYTPSKVNVTAKIVNDDKTLSSVTISFNKFTAGKKYADSSKITVHESIIVSDVTAKKDDVVAFTAYVTDANGRAVSTGKVVFKLNGNTLKSKGNPIKVRVVGGVAQLNYTIPSYSAKKYRLTAVYGNGSTRLEDNATLTIQKLKTEITDVKFTQTSDTGLLVARVVDEHGDIVERDTKITVKINGKTVIRQVKVKDGLINMIFDLSSYRDGSHTLTIIAGENGLYETSRVNKAFYKNTSGIMQFSTRITDLHTSVRDGMLGIVADVVDDMGSNLENDVKLSIKLDGKTLVNKAIVSGGVINRTLNVSAYDKGVYNLTLIVGESRLYKSYVLNTTVSIS